MSAPGHDELISTNFFLITGIISLRKNDQLTWALLISLAGFVLVMAGGMIFKGFVIRKFSDQSPEVVKYYYWMFPFGLGLSLYCLLEAFAWQLKHSVLTNYLREVQFRFYTILLVVLILFRST